MSRRPLTTALVLLALVVALLPIASSPQETQSRWFASVSADLPDGVTDRFTASASDVPAAVGAVTNVPAVQSANTAATHQGWVNVSDSTVRAGKLGGQALATDVGLTYAVTPSGGTCAGGTSAYWTARSSGQVVLGTTYSRTADRIAAALLSPTQQNTLCMPLPRTGTDNAFLLKHAGRDLVIRTTLALRSELPATWDSTSQSIDSTFRVTFPRPTPRQDNFTSISASCAVTTLPSRVQLRWAWPDSTTTATTTTPAVDGWELWGRAANSNGAWQQYNSTTANQRTLDIPATALGTSSFEVKIIARLDSNRTYWVESTHLILISGTLLSPRCDAVRANSVPNPGGPVVLP